MRVLLILLLAALAQAEPNQRAADLAAFQAIRDDMQQEIEELRTESRSRARHS